MFKAGCLICCVLYSCLSFSQFNDSTHYYVNYSATGTLNRATEGNSYVLNNTFTFEVAKKHMSLNSSSSWVYGESNSQLNLNDFSSSLNFDLYKAVRTWYYWGLASYTSSFSLQINNQFQTGAGIGYNAIRKNNAELVISDGLLFETSNLYDAEPGKRAYVTARNSLRVKYRFVIAKIVILDGVHFWQPALSDLDNYILRSGNNLSVTLNKWLRVTTAVAYNRYNLTKRENLLVNFGLTVEKYF